VLFGLMQALSGSGVFALDRLDVVRRAEHKSLQLAIARRLGLDVPHTLVSNDADAVELPADVRTKTLALMDALGLNYGAFDFIVSPEGRHVFLEVNPVGEFMWLCTTPGLPIDEALADVLCGRARRR
jgi:glutathione synthase/RimK-type ligase-like ATP-grasp enzyme